MAYAIRSALAAAIMLLAALPVARAADAVDLLLVLAADVSRSVDHEKFLLQREGYAAAIADPAVLQSILSGPNRRIAVSFVEWSGFGAQKTVVDWMVIDGPEAAKRFGDLVIEAPRSFSGRTSISGAIEFGFKRLTEAPYTALRRTIDLSGDGTNNAGRDPKLARDEVVAKDVTINGLVIHSDRPIPWNPEHTNPPGGLANYYRDNVIGGPGAFVMAAQDFKSFGRALIRKLIAEIAFNVP